MRGEGLFWHILGLWFSTQGGFVPRGTFGNFQLSKQRKEGSYWPPGGEARDADEHPAMHRIAQPQLPTALGLRNAGLGTERGPGWQELENKNWIENYYSYL